nr:hypothetical protein [uncultured Rhodopila sp.]
MEYLSRFPVKGLTAKAPGSARLRGEPDTGARRYRHRATNRFSRGMARAERIRFGNEIAAAVPALQVVGRMMRCPATEADPGTAERDADAGSQHRPFWENIELACTSSRG